MQERREIVPSTGTTVRWATAALSRALITSCTRYRRSKFLISTARRGCVVAAAVCAFCFLLSYKHINIFASLQTRIGSRSTTSTNMCCTYLLGFCDSSDNVSLQLPSSEVIFISLNKIILWSCVINATSNALGM